MGVIFRFHSLVPGYEKYTATEDGEVFSWKNNTPVKVSPWKQNTGYMMVKLNGKGFGVHTVVARAWLGIPKNDGMVVNHKDCDKLNNKLSNLEYLTSSENKKHALANNRGLKGRKVCQLDLEGKLVATFNSIIEAARATGINNRCISTVCTGRKKRKAAGGYMWCYHEKLEEKRSSKKEISKYHVLQYTLKGEFVKKYDNLNDAGKAVGSSAGNISNVCRGVQKSAKNYIWKYEEIKREPKIVPAEQESKAWVKLDEYPMYKISQDGRVYSITYKRFMSGSSKPDGRRYITIYNKAHTLKTVPIHRLVAIAYIPRLNKEADIVNHKDGDPSNNNITNLEWCTHSENTKHAYATGLKKGRRIAQIDEKGKTVKIHITIAEARRVTGICGIPKVLKGERKIAGGYKWEYCDV